MKEDVFLPVGDNAGLHGMENRRCLLVVPDLVCFVGVWGKVDGHEAGGGVAALAAAPFLDPCANREGRVIVFLMKCRDLKVYNYNI